MGIRFRCQACSNKVNVKDFLAGKRGICPKCGAKFTIPEQSDPEFQAAHEEPEPEAAPATPAAASPSITIAAPSSPAGGMPVAAPIATATAAGHTPATSTAQVFAAPQFPAPQQQPQPTPYAPAMPAPGYAAGPRDPFAEAPAAQWYVRHKSGQQYGPAPAPTMQKWLSEGRVPGDGMVWREGWSDWQVASLVFPQLAAPQMTAARGPAAAPYTPPGMFPRPAAPPLAVDNDPFSFGAPAPGAAKPASTFVYQKRDNSQMMLIISIVLFLAIAAVGTALWFVLTRPKEEPPKEESTEEVAWVWNICAHSSAASTKL